MRRLLHLFCLSVVFYKGEGCIALPPPPPPATTTPAPSTEAPTTSAGSAGARSYVAGLTWSFDSTNSPFCAGALIAPSWLVTTASCSYADNTKVAATKVKAVLGEETLGGAGDFFQVSSVTKIVTHPDYDSSSDTKTDNIALWKLSSPVSTDTYTRLCLPSQGAQAAGDASLVGWRISEHVGALSSSLQETETRVVEEAECGAGADTVCTGAETKCQGDIGAPLVQGFRLIGVMSGHQGSSDYGQFSNLAKYTDWIKSKLSDNGGETICVAPQVA